jgi:hypothetical protein
VRASALPLTAAVVAALLSSSADAKMSRWSNRLSGEQLRCLSGILSDSHWSRESQSEMPAIAQVLTTRLSDGRTAYVYVFEAIGWCGTAGCPLMIGEPAQDEVCRLLYDGFGDIFIALRRQDHGYRRILTPCEARFDGRQYQQLHENCPSPVTPR